MNREFAKLCDCVVRLIESVLLMKNSEYLSRVGIFFSRAVNKENKLIFFIKESSAIEHWLAKSEHNILQNMSKVTVKKMFLVISKLVMGIKYQQNAAKFLTIGASFSVDMLSFRKGMNEVGRLHYCNFF